MIRALIAIATIVSIVLYLVPNLLEAHVSPELITLGLIALVGLYATSTWTGWSYVGTLFRVGLAIGAFALVVMRYSGGSPARMWQVGGTIFALVIVLFGLYLMISGGRFKTRKRGDQILIGKRRE